jgi:hypothetical protein
LKSFYEKALEAMKRVADELDGEFALLSCCICSLFVVR